MNGDPRVIRRIHAVLPVCRGEDLPEHHAVGSAEHAASTAKPVRESGVPAYVIPIGIERQRASISDLARLGDRFPAHTPGEREAVIHRPVVPGVCLDFEIPISPVGVAKTLGELIGLTQAKIGDRTVAEVVVDVPDRPATIGFVAIVLDSRHAAPEAPGMRAPPGLQGSTRTELVDRAIDRDTAGGAKRREPVGKYGAYRVGSGRQQHSLAVKSD